MTSAAQDKDIGRLAGVDNGTKHWRQTRGHRLYTIYV